MQASDLGAASFVLLGPPSLGVKVMWRVHTLHPGVPRSHRAVTKRGRELGQPTTEWAGLDLVELGQPTTEWAGLDLVAAAR